MNGSTIKNKGPLFVLKPASERFEVWSRFEHGYLFMRDVQLRCAFELDGGFLSDPNEPRIFNFTKPWLLGIQGREKTRTKPKIPWHFILLLRYRTLLANGECPGSRSLPMLTTGGKASRIYISYSLGCCILYFLSLRFRSGFIRQVILFLCDVLRVKGRSRISRHPGTTWYPAWNSSRFLDQTTLAY